MQLVLDLRYTAMVVSDVYGVNRGFGSCYRCSRTGKLGCSTLCFHASSNRLRIPPLNSPCDFFCGLSNSAYGSPFFCSCHTHHRQSFAEGTTQEADHFHCVTASSHGSCTPPPPPGIYSFFTHGPPLCSSRGTVIPI